MILLMTSFFNFTDVIKKWLELLNKLRGMWCHQLPPFINLYLNFISFANSLDLSWYIMVKFPAYVYFKDRRSVHERLRLWWILAIYFGNLADYGKKFYISIKYVEQPSYNTMKNKNSKLKSSKTTVIACTVSFYKFQCSNTLPKAVCGHFGSQNYYITITLLTKLYYKNIINLCLTHILLEIGKNYFWIWLMFE